MSCDSVLIDDNPSNEVVNNFQEFWDEYDRHYPFFELKGVDWGQVYDDHIDRVENLKNPFELFDIVSDIILSLEDGHADITTSETKINFPYTLGYPENSPKNATAYLSNFTFINNSLGYGAAALGYGDINDSNLGYIKVNTFEGPETLFDDIDDIIEKFSNKDGLVIDIRSNLGGADRNAKLIASRFVNEKSVFRKVKIRNGEDHSSFTDYKEDFIEPATDVNRFLKPIVVITNRATFSAAESFLLAMRTQAHVSVLGGITGGGAGLPLIRELPNGWILRIPSTFTVTPDMESYEGVGLMPDILVSNTPDEVFNRIDKILERAIDQL